MDTSKPDEGEINLDKFEEIPECTYCCMEKITSQYSNLWKGSTTNLGVVLEEPDEFGFFSVSYIYSQSDEELMLLVRQRNNPSLYRGKLGLVF